MGKHQIQPGCGERVGRRGKGRPNLSRKTKFLGANGDRKNKNKNKTKTELFSDNHKQQDWHPCLLMPSLLYAMYECEKQQFLPLEVDAQKV